VVAWAVLAAICLWWLTATGIGSGISGRIGNLTDI
jgi:hypothetical protein